MTKYKIQNELLLQLGKSWNNLDVRFLKNILSENIVYESQWVLSPFNGRDEVLNFLRLKFDSIRKSIQSNRMILIAEMATLPDVDNRPCLVLTQTENSEIRRATVLIDIRGEKISKINICFIPKPQTAEPTGYFPS